MRKSDVVFKLIERDFSITREELVSSGTGDRVKTEVRAVAFILLRNGQGLSLHQVARIFNRSHSTIVYGIKQVIKKPNLLLSAIKIQAELIEAVS